MKLKWKRLWIKALLNPKMKQGRGALRRGNEYCCLGVLCKIVAPREKWGSGSRKSFRYEENYPPMDVLKLVGLSSRSARTLAVLNDKGQTFKQIAAQITRRY